MILCISKKNSWVLTVAWDFLINLKKKDIKEHPWNEMCKQWVKRNITNYDPQCLVTFKTFFGFLSNTRTSTKYGC